MPKPVFTVLLAEDEIFSSMFKLIIPDRLRQHYEVKCVYFTRASQLLKFAEDKAFDLVFFYLWNITWDIGCGNVIQRFALANAENATSEGTIVDFLGQLKARGGKQIVVTQGMGLTDWFARVSAGECTRLQ